MKTIFGLYAILTILAPARAASPRRPHVGSLTTFTDQIIPLIVLGDGWTQRFVLQNVDDTIPSAGTISFFSDTGGPLSVNIKGKGVVTALPFNLSVGTTTFYETVPSNTPQKLGWASLHLGSGGQGNMFGQTIFRKQTAGLPDFMCSMPFGAVALHKLTTFFDNTGTNYTGMGIVAQDNCASVPCTGSVNLRVTVRDDSGFIVSQKIVSQKQGTLHWMNLGTEYPETNGIAGAFEVDVIDAATTILSGVSLEFAGNGAFTAISTFEH
jgi:hypothetical protein